jgi:transcription termination factor Rho
MSYIEEKISEILNEAKGYFEELKKKYEMSEKDILEMIGNYIIKKYRIAQGDIEFREILINYFGEIRIRAIGKKYGKFTLQDVDKITEILNNKRFKVHAYKKDSTIYIYYLYIHAVDMERGKSIILSSSPFYSYDNYSYFEVMYSLGTGSIIDNICRELGIPLYPYVFEKKEK